MSEPSGILATIEAARTPSLPDVAYAEIREAIISCRLKPNSELRQERIANQLGISRLPVREALRRLEVEGLVVLRPRRGFVVADINRAEIIDLFELRAVLEGKAGYLATVSRTEEDVEKVREFLDLMEGVLAEHRIDVDRFSALNAAFHDHLLAPARRPHLERALRVTLGACERYTRMSVTLSEDISPSSTEHQRILEAYISGDADKMSRLSEEHCRSTSQRLLVNLEKRGLIANS